MVDVSHTILAKSDQLNADDLIGREITITITDVKLAGAEQPVKVSYKDDNGKPYCPCKSMRRVLVQLWGVRLHKQFGYFDETYKSAGDYEFWMRLASKGVKFYHVREPLGSYLKRQNSVEHREPLRSLWEANHARMKYREVANV